MLLRIIHRTFLFIFYCFIIFINDTVFGQVTIPTAMDLKQTVPPSPTASALGQYGNLPVSLYTGTTNVSIPLYEINAGSINLPITLSYNTGGIKVADFASSVGLGWVLNAGGSITRAINGLADEGMLSYPNMITDNPTLGQLKGSLLAQVSPTLVDLQPDIFYFNFNGKSGKFIITKTSLISITPHQNIKIQAYRNDGSVQDPPFTGIGILNFRITDEDGNIYEFRDHEFNNSTSYEDQGGGPPDHGQGRYYGGYTAWYLTRMISPAKDTISFVYNDYSLNYDLPSSEQQYVLLSIVGDQALGGDHERYVKNLTACENQNKRLQKIIFPTGSITFSSLQSRKDLYGDSELNKISVYNTDGSLVKGYSFSYKYSTTFEYSTDALVDGSSLSIVGGDNYYYKYLNHLNGLSGGATASYRRLMLVGLSELDNLGKAKGKNYSFEYDFSHGGLPSRFSKSRDYWGYYNHSADNENQFLNYQLIGTDATNSSNYILVGKDADSNYCKQSSLTKITYPTGGSTQINYEIHKAYLGKGVLPPDVIPQSCQMSVDYNNYHYLGYTDTLISSAPCLYKVFTINTTGATVNISVAGIPYQDQTIHPIGFNIYNDSSKQLVVPMGDIYNSNQVIHTYNNYYTVQCSYSPYLPYGTYKLIFTPYNGTQYIGNDTYHTTYGVNPTCTVNGWSNIIVHPDSIVLNRFIGGLRTKSTIDFDPVTNKSLQKNYYYTLPNDTLSSGELLSGVNFVYDFNEIAHSDDEEQGHIFSYDAVSKYKVINGESNYALSTTQGSYVGYSTVTVTESDPVSGAINGKSEYHYTSPSQFPDYYGIVPGMLLYSYYPPATNYSYSPTPGPMNPYPYVPADNRDWQRGLLLQRIDYNYANNQFTPIRYENYTYGQPQYLDTIKGFTTRYYQQGPSTTDTVLYMASSQGTPTQYQEIYAAKQYSYLSGYVPLLSKSVTSVENGVSLTTTENYVYNNIPSNMLPTSTSSTNSKKEIITTNYKYPTDYVITGTPNNNIAKGVQNLQTSHIISPPIEVFTQKSNADGSNLRTVAATLSTYKPTIPFPDIIYSFDNDRPVTSFQPATITASSSNFDYHYEARVQFDAYDIYNNILQQHKINDINHSYVWGYNHTLPIAEAVHASSNEIFFTSFEEPGLWSAALTLSTKHVHDGAEAGYIKDTSSGELYAYSSLRDTFAVPLATAKMFHYSGWFYSTGPQVQIWLFTKTSTEVNYYSSNSFIDTTATGKWVYVEKDYSVPAGTKEVWMRVDNNGKTSSGKTDVWFDDLRFYPSDAQMTTYTYAPLVGMTSKCDINNKTTYYEYDGLGRLNLIRDDNQNIVKQYCYNYMGQNTNCKLFSNKTQTKGFAKMDCSDTSMVGIEQLDSVQAGTFYSDISQGDADTMAINYLDSTGQPDANLNGSCAEPVILTLVNYDHITDFTLTLTDVYDSTRSFTVPFPLDSAVTTQKIPQGRYNIAISKPGNTVSHVFTASGPGGSIQVNSVTASWSNVYVNTDVFDKLTIGIP